MNNIIRMWNQNRKKIIIIAAIVVFCLVIIQILNKLAGEEIANGKVNEQVVKEEKNLPTKSIITGEKVKEETTKTNVDIIEKFAEKCNKGNIKEAYSLLTNECKETLFQTEEAFTNNYYNIIFSENRTIKIENYKNSKTTNTYLVTFYEDVLSSGKIDQTNTYKDYITVEKDTGKININSLISCKEINKKNEDDKIEINVLKQEIYKDYEIYKFEVKNNTENTVILDTRTTSKTMYITDNQNIKYTAYAHELPKSTYEMPKYTSKTFSIKFNKKYNSADETQKVTFSDVIKNYEQYQEQNEEQEKIKIDIKL